MKLEHMNNHNTTKKRSWLITGSIFILLSILLGAFGAHWLGDSWHSERGPEIWDIGTRYQMYMGLGLLVLAGYADWIRRHRVIFILLVLGTLSFSCSIYTLALCSHSVVRAIAGPLTPIGGLLMIAAWVLVIWEVSSNRSAR